MKMLVVAALLVTAGSVVGSASAASYDPIRHAVISEKGRILDVAAPAAGPKTVPEMVAGAWKPSQMFGLFGKSETTSAVTPSTPAKGKPLTSKGREDIYGRP